MGAHDGFGHYGQSSGLGVPAAFSADGHCWSFSVPTADACGNDEGVSALVPLAEGGRRRRRGGSFVACVVLAFPFDTAVPAHND